MRKKGAYSNVNHWNREQSPKACMKISTAPGQAHVRDDHWLYSENDSLPPSISQIHQLRGAIAEPRVALKKPAVLSSDSDKDDTRSPPSISQIHHVCTPDVIIEYVGGNAFAYETRYTRSRLRFLVRSTCLLRGGVARCGRSTHTRDVPPGSNHVFAFLLRSKFSIREHATSSHWPSSQRCTRYKNTHRAS